MKAMYLLPFTLTASLALANGPAGSTQGQLQAQAQGQGQTQSLDNSITNALSETNNLSAPTSVEASPSISSENNSSFFAFGTTFPNSQGCFAGAQGGGGNNSGAGFLGFHYLDHNCWMNQLASQTRHVETKARLDCDGGKYRNAIAFDQPRNRVKRQRYCIDYTIKVYQTEIAEMEKYVDDALASGLLQIREDLVTERDAKCDSRVERCEAAVLK